MNRKDFGNKLAKIRISKNISAYDLSLRINKSHGYIHQVENAQLNISLKAIFEICEVLEIEPKVLFEN